MAKQLEGGEGKVNYKEYTSIIEKNLIKFFGKYKDLKGCHSHLSRATKKK